MSHWSVESVHEFAEDVRERLLINDTGERSGPLYLSAADALGSERREGQTRARSSSAVDHLVLPPSRCELY
jgi:hypothetical protein